MSKKLSHAARRKLAASVGFGSMLSRAIDKRDLSTYSFSQRLGSYPSYVALLVDDDHDPRLSTMVQAAKAIDMRVEVTLVDETRGRYAKKKTATKAAPRREAKAKMKAAPKKRRAKAKAPTRQVYDSPVAAPKKRKARKVPGRISAAVKAAMAMSRSNGAEQPPVVDTDSTADAAPTASAPVPDAE
jgi:hypothetical protein